MTSRIFALLLATFFAQSCATGTKEKSLILTALSGSAGAAYGASRPEYKTQNTVLYAAIGVAVGAVSSLFIFDSDKQARRLREESNQLRTELDLLRSPKPFAEMPAMFGARVPEKFRKLVQPGEWRVSEIDTWLEDGENRLVHQNLIMELTPPALVPQNSK